MMGKQYIATKLKYMIFSLHTFKWTSFQWWPWHFQLTNSNLLKPMSNLGISLFLVNAMTMDKYSSLLLILVVLQPLLSMATSSQATLFLILGSCGIWEQVTLMRLVKGTLDIDNLLQFLCLKQQLILYLKFCNFNSTLIWNYVAHARSKSWKYATNKTYETQCLLQNPFLRTTKTSSPLILLDLSNILVLIVHFSFASKNWKGHSIMFASSRLRQTSKLNIGLVFKNNKKSLEKFKNSIFIVSVKKLIFNLTLWKV